MAPRGSTTSRAVPVVPTVRAAGVSEPRERRTATKCGRHVDDGRHMEDAGFTPFHGDSDHGHARDAHAAGDGGHRIRSGSHRGEMEPGDRMLRLVEDLDSRLRALCGVIDARDAQDIRELARTLAATAREEVECDLAGLECTGLEDDGMLDDGLLDEVEISALTERAEELVSFCRMAIDSACEADPDHPDVPSDGDPTQGDDA